MHCISFIHSFKRKRRRKKFGRKTSYFLLVVLFFFKDSRIIWFTTQQHDFFPEHEKKLERIKNSWYNGGSSVFTVPLLLLVMMTMMMMTTDTRRTMKATVFLFSLTVKVFFYSLTLLQHTYKTGVFHWSQRWQWGKGWKSAVRILVIQYLSRVFLPRQKRVGKRKEYRRSEWYHLTVFFSFYFVQSPASKPRRMIASLDIYQ